MTHPFAESVELLALLDAVCEESITAEQMQRLEQLVLNHPEAEAFYVQYLSLHADLTGHFGALQKSMPEPTRGRQPGTETAREPAEAARSKVRGVLSRRVLVFVTSMAAGVLLALSVGQRWFHAPTPTDQPTETIDDAVAVLLQAPGAKWEPTNLALRAGAPLCPGWLQLKAGFAHIEFYSGAVVILQAPAEFELISPTEAYCRKGKLRASVPPQAQGFTIGSPKVNLVDRGTEFGLQVEEGAQTEVHVFQGKVDLFDPEPGQEAALLRELTTGQSIRLEEPGRSTSIQTDPTSFVTAQDLAVRSAEETRGRHQNWLAVNKTLRQDPSLVVYYPFEAEESWSRTLLDQAGGRQEPHDGAIVGCLWETGRWPGKHGLAFRRTSDRVRLHVPGQFESLTLMAWVRVDALPNSNNSLLLSDGWKQGGIHWQIGKTGTLILGVRGPPNALNAHYHAPDVFTPERLGQWVHLAAAYDRTSATVTHYLDGRPVSQCRVKFDIPLRIGDAEIGNWNVPARRDDSHIRYFSGCMDEFMLFSRALPEGEVERLYLQGRPAM